MDKQCKETEEEASKEALPEVTAKRSRIRRMALLRNEIALDAPIRAVRSQMKDG